LPPAVVCLCAEILLVVHDRNLDGDAAGGGNERGAAFGCDFHNRLDRVAGRGTVDTYFVSDAREAALDLAPGVAAAGFDIAGDLAFEAGERDVDDSRALYAPDLMAHHDAREEIAQRRGAGIVPAVHFVGNEAVTFYGRAELQAVQSLALHGCHRALRLALFTRAALRELARRDIFQIRLDLEHFSSACSSANLSNRWNTCKRVPAAREFLNI